MWEGVTRGQLRPIDLKSSIILSYLIIYYQCIKYNVASRYSEKNLTGVCGSGFDRIPLAKEILVENIPLANMAMEHFLLMSPFLQDFKEFQPKYSPLEKFSKNRR